MPNILARATSLNPDDTGLSVVVHRDGPDFLLRYEPRGDWKIAQYHECVVISNHSTFDDAHQAAIKWQEASVSNGSVIVADPNGKGWFIVNNSDNNSNHSLIVGDLNGYPDYHKAAAALAELQGR